MVQTMGKGMYSMSTVVQGEKLGQFLDTEMPSMDNLKVLHRRTCCIAHSRGMRTHQFLVALILLVFYAQEAFCPIVHSR